MNKTAIKNFAIWARNKLIADISYRAGLMGITPDGIHPALPQSTGQTKFYDIGTAEPYAISGESIRQREHLAELIRRKAEDSGFQTAFKYIIEEVAYTWFNRLIAVRFMEVNDYLPSHIRVLSSEQGKIEPDLVTTPFDADFDFSRDEQQTIIELKNENKLDEVFRLLFIKQCNSLNEILPALFEKTNDYTELLLGLSVVDQDGIVYHLVHDIPEEDFDVNRGGQVEIIGWLFQYYNTEPKDETFALLKKNIKITKERIPSATQLFTPDWIVRYMVENSLGRLWIEHLIASGDFRTEAEIAADFGWKYYLPEAEQEPEVVEQLKKIREERKELTPEAIQCIDPCMGSGHICVYLFSVLMQIYESAGYGQREAAKSILENNLYGLDIDDRAFQMAYFAVMMKAREYNRRILNGENRPNLYSIQESNGIDREHLKFFGRSMDKAEREAALQDMTELLDIFVDAKEYGSILTVKIYDWERLERFANDYDSEGQISFESVGLEETSVTLVQTIEQGRCLAQKYDVTATNPPYMSGANLSPRLLRYVQGAYPNSKMDLYSVFIDRLHEFGKKDSLMGLMTSYTWMFLTSFEKFRMVLLSHNTILSLVQPEYHSFFESANVPICIYVLRNQNSDYRGTYIKLTDFYGTEVQSIRYLEAIATKKCPYKYYAKQSGFFKMPGTPVAYWVGDSTIELFETGSMMGKYAELKQGLITGDNERFVRGWHECDANTISSAASNKKWFFFHKGGEYRKWYGNLALVVNWENNGNEIINFRDRNGKQKSRPQNVQFYFKEGFTWTSLTVSDFNVRYMPAGAIFAAKGSAGFCKNKETLYYLMGLCNSKVAMVFLSFLAPTMDYNNGSVVKMPTIIQREKLGIVNQLVIESIEISKQDWDSFDISWDFRRHPLARRISTIKGAYAEWKNECDRRYILLKAHEEELNRVFIDIYNFKDELAPEVGDKDVTVRRADLQRDIRSLLSYAIGCMFGRYSLDVDGLAYAGGEWDSNKYNSFIPDADNVIPITDEEYLEDDIVSRLCEWLKVVYGKETLEENLDFIAKALGNKGSSSREIIRNYFLTDFFKDHCQTYSVTGSGKRPIYWLFDSGKQNGFKALTYLHRYNADTIGNLRIDYLHRMQRIYESEITRMQDMIDNSKNNREVAQATKRREKLTKQLKECRDYDEKLAHLALSRIELDLDDGVKVNYRKLQTANDGKFYEVLADSKNIMSKK